MMHDSTDLWIGIQAKLGEPREVTITDRTTMAMDARGGVHHQVEASVSVWLRKGTTVSFDEVLALSDRWRVARVHITADQMGTLHEIDLLRLDS